MKRLKLWLTKWQLRRSYFAEKNILNSMDCGHTLALHISPRYESQTMETDRLYKACMKIEKELSHA